MQTFLSKVTILFTGFFSQASICGGIMSSLPLLDGFLTKTSAYILTLYNYISGISFLLAIFIMLVSKYLSVYHSTMMANLDEGKALPLLAILDMILTLTLAAVEYGALSDIEEDTTYMKIYSGHIPEESASKTTFLIVILVDLITLLFVVIRIEHDYHEDGYLSKIKNYFRGNKVEPEPFQNPALRRESRLSAALNLKVPSSILDMSGYTINVIRLLFVIAVIFVVVLFTSNSSRYRFMAIRTFFSLVCPGIFIWNHEGIRNTLKHRIQDMYSSLRTLK